MGCNSKAEHMLGPQKMQIARKGENGTIWKLKRPMSKSAAGLKVWSCVKKHPIFSPDYSGSLCNMHTSYACKKGQGFD